MTCEKTQVFIAAALLLNNEREIINYNNHGHGWKSAGNMFTTTFTKTHIRFMKFECLYIPPALNSHYFIEASERNRLNSFPR